MPSDVQSALAQFQLTDYLSLVLATAVVYDYCLTISKEVTYIWKRPWTWVSTLFLLIRYAVGTTFIPGVKVRHSPPVSRYLNYLLWGWTWTIFWTAADMAMILRVYAMYNRSKIILGVLLVIYILEGAILLVSASIYSDPNYNIVSVARFLNISVCDVMPSPPTWSIAATIVQCILSTVLCTLVVVKFVRGSLQMYQATRRWEVNSYIALLSRDGLFYSLTTLLNSLTTLLCSFQSIDKKGPGILLSSIFANIILYTLTPRFVIHVRELYVLASQGRRDVDIGFGLSSGMRRNVRGSTTIGTIAFAEAVATIRLEDWEERATDDSEERAESDHTMQVLVA
ncbi:hypothetical protein EV363DRAFT_1349687 [Boletus edulis]|nr:hypothetical protein EV363DRAFT_1349687 [Boletus edulis]